MDFSRRCQGAPAPRRESKMSGGDGDEVEDVAVACRHSRELSSSQLFGDVVLNRILVEGNMPEYMNVRSRPEGALQYELLQVALNNHVLHRGHGDFEKICVGGVGKVAINLLLRVPVQRLELVQEVLASGLVVILGAMVIGEAVVGDGALGQLLLEQVHLVEEQDQGRLGEPMRIGD